MSEAFMSAKQLRSFRKLSQTFPEYKKQKLNDKSSENETKAELDKYLDVRHASLSEGKCAKLGQLIRGEYIPEENVIKVTKLKSRIQHMGYNGSSQSRNLYPEEAIYLMDCKQLEVFYKGVPLSIIEAYAKFLSDSTHHDKYVAYSHLTTLGYTLIRFKHRHLPPSVSKVKPETKVELNSECGEQQTKVEFTGAFARYDKIDANFKQSLSQPRTGLLLENSRIKFPSIDEHFANKIIPSSHLLPHGISFSNVHHDDDSPPPAKRKCYVPLTSANNWYEYKNSLKQSIHSNQLTTCNAAPLIQPSTATSSVAIFQRLRSVFPSHSDAEITEEIGLNVDFDVYLPSSLKKCSARNTRPDHRLIVINQNDPVLKPQLIQRLMDKLGDDVPIHIAIVDNGDVTFYKFNYNTIQPDVLPD
ncbi:tRNA splicing endonuclease 54 [Chamberlinius hualienensis]